MSYHEQNGYDTGASLVDQRPDEHVELLTAGRDGRRESHGSIGDRYSLQSFSTQVSRLDGEIDLSLRAPASDTSRPKEPPNTEYSGRQGLLGKRLHRQLWTPFWLRKTTLIGLALSFLSFAVALIIVWHIATVNTGLSLRLTQNHYVWTYGPTAILVIVISLWRQVDYYCKALTPWQEMWNGTTKPSRSLLLDYISPLQAKTLVAAVRNHDPAVAASVLGFGLLKLIVVFSTGLLVSRPTNFVDDSSPLMLTTNFDALKWNATSALGSYAVSQPPVNFVYGDSGSSGPLYAYYGVTEHGMPDPVGTKSGLAFQSFRLGEATVGQNTTEASAEVDVFVPYPACELTHVSISPRTTNDFSNSTEGGAVCLIIDSPTCHLGHDSFSLVYVEKKNPRTEICEPRELRAGMQWVNCSLPATLKQDNSSSSYIAPPYNQSDGDYRWLLTISDIQYSQTFGTASPNNTLIPNITSWSRNVEGVTAILCSISYAIVKMNLTYDFLQAGSPSAVQLPSPGNLSIFDKLPGLSDSTLNSAIIATLGAAAQVLGSGNPPMTGSTLSALDPLFQLMKAASGASESFEPMLDGGVMRTAARQVFSGIAAQYAQQNFVFPTLRNTTGQVEYVEDRLFVRPASLWSMVVGFVIMSCLAGTILLTTSAAVVPRDPDSVGALASILAGSGDVQQLLKGTGHLKMSKMRQKLSRYGFRTSSYDAFQISITYRAASNDEERPLQALTTRSEWKPLAIRQPMIVLTLVLPVVAIGALEALQQLSDRKGGLFTIETKTAEYAAYYLPTLILLCIATLYNSLDFTIAIFTPFSALRHGSMPAKRSIMCFLLGKTPLLSLFQALRNRHLGSALSNTAGLVGSLLTIIVSGLWILDPAVPRSHSVDANRVDTWNTSWSNSLSNDSGAGSLFSLIQYQGLKDPAWTWNELAFPKMNFTTTGADLGNLLSPANSSVPPEYTVKVPALRASLNCTVLTREDLKIGNEVGVGSHAGTYITSTSLIAQFELSPQCLSSLPIGQKYVNFTIGYAEILGYPTNGNYTASFFDLHVPCSGSSCYDDANGSPFTDIPNNPFGCPSVGFAFGFFRVNHTTLDNVTAAVCYQNVREVETEVTYIDDLTSGLISETRPPKPDESTAKLLTNGTDGFTAFPYRPQASFRQSLEKSSAASEDSLGTIGAGNAGYDAVFDFIVNGPYGIAPDELLGPANAGRLLNAVNRLYSQYMAQVINLNFRHNISAPNEGSTANNPQPDGTYPGTLFIPTPRLKVNVGSKLTLQIMLAVMVFFGGVAFATVEMRGTLPHNPCSIAGTMSLLAGSELCERNKIPEGSEWMNDKELESVFRSQGWLFSLGWWGKAGKNGSGEEEEEEEGEERFGIDIGRAEWR